MDKKILVAEDERPMANALELKLKKEGFDVKVAYNGEEAVNFIVENKFDLVLLDLIMPKKDGFTVLKEIQDKGISVPIIITSNLSQEEDQRKSKELWSSPISLNTNLVY